MLGDLLICWGTMIIGLTVLCVVETAGEALERGWLNVRHKATRNDAS
jgi:hypothetical protein